MQINENYLTTLLSSILLFICSFTLANRRGLHSIDGTNSRLYTSPVLSGSNITNLINIDHSKPLNCITTLDLESSWILIDLGYIVSGIAQLRLYGDLFNENSHNYLSNIEIKIAEIVTSKEISNSFPNENMYFKTCGTTGTVSKDTHNVVVDCIKGFDARWILLKKKNILSLCFINILQNTVKPKCFRQILSNNELFPYVSVSFNAFKYRRGETRLGCFQNCFIENSCQATAFEPFDQNIGICRLFKSKTNKYHSKCDDPCILSVNLCQLGKQINITPANENILIKIPTFVKPSYALSVEISGQISCNEDDCGETEIFIIDLNEKMNLCNRINPFKYRFLVKEVFFCDKLVENPVEIIFKTRTKNQTYKYRFNSVILRISEANSFVLDLFKYFNNEKISTTTIKTTKLTTETSKIHTRKSIKLKINSTAEMKTKFLNYLSTETPIIMKFLSTSSQLKTTKMKLLDNSSFKSIISISNKQITSKPISKNLNKNHSIKTISLFIKKIISTNSPKLSTKFTETNLVTNNKKMDLKFNLINSENSSNQQQYENTNIKLRNNKEFLISTVFTKSSSSSSSLTNFNDNRISSTKFSVNRSESLHLPNQSTTLPYNWIILVIFIAILILVTLIVLLITFLESRRKKKEWDIPPNGLFPMDQISEQVTLQSSLHESTIRKVS